MLLYLRRHIWGKTIGIRAFYNTDGAQHRRTVASRRISYSHRLRAESIGLHQRRPQICVEGSQWGLLLLLLLLLLLILLRLHTTTTTTTTTTITTTNNSCYTHREQLLVVLPPYCEYHCSYNDRLSAFVYAGRLIFSSPITTHLWM